MVRVATFRHDCTHTAVGGYGPWAMAKATLTDVRKIGVKVSVRHSFAGEVHVKLGEQPAVECCVGRVEKIAEALCSERRAVSGAVHSPREREREREDRVCARVRAYAVIWTRGTASVGAVRHASRVCRPCVQHAQLLRALLLVNNTFLLVR